MKRLVIGIGATVVIAACLLGGVSQSAYAQNVSNFTISRFDAEYYLDKDAEGRSTLRTVEKITATFPEYDQNHGLERVLPVAYDGHTTSLNIESVRDGAGEKLQYSESQSGDSLVLRIGESDSYVHGTKTYVIVSTQRDVTRFFSDTNADELYWDVNGTQWAQAMGVVHARVHVAASLAQQLTGKTGCYSGVEGSTTPCVLERETTGGEVVFSTTVSDVGAYENVTFALGFLPQTFVGYQQTWQEKAMAILVSVWQVLLVVGSILAAAAIIWVSSVYYRTLRRGKGRGTIVPEYLPPKDASVLVSAQVLGNSLSDVTAQLIDLAVRHYIKIYVTKDKTLFAAAEYELEIARPTNELRSEERQVLRDLFGNTHTSVGSRFAMKRLQSDYSLRKKLLDSRKAVQKRVRSDYALFEHATKEARLFRTVGWVGILVGVVTLSPLPIVAGVVGLACAHNAWPLTQKGRELREYLLGLKQYIGVAEEERLKLLQSPDGAEKIGQKLPGKNSGELVKLYERVLPYAVLFGLEKEWVKQLGAYYTEVGTQPDWYVGSGVFNAVVFSTALSGFSSQSSSYSASSSSTSGGSDGGGSSGGGGGGGGGGGW
jgi:hypothetical protein